MGARNDVCRRLTALLDRRRLLKTTAGAVGLAVTGAAPRRPAAVAAQGSGSTLVFLATDNVYSLDPAQNWDYGGGATILA